MQRSKTYAHHHKMEAVQTQLEFYRYRGHTIPNTDHMSENEVQAILSKIQDDDYIRTSQF